MAGITDRRRAELVAGVLPLLLAGVWAALALANPTTTYHLAPAVVTVAWPLGARTRAGRATRPREALVPVGAALALVAAALLLLLASGALEGPSLVPGTDALGESVLLALAGAGYGGRVLARERTPWYLR